MIRGSEPVRKLTWLGVPVLLALVFYSSQLIRRSADVRAAAPRAGAIKLSAALLGPPETVFDTKDACEQIDIPDAFPRAFRDYENRVHLMATHYVARAMIGPSLDQVRHDCRVVYRSPFDPDPSHFLDANWLDSFYTGDGKRVAALVHTEYHGNDHPGMCGDPASPTRSDDCAWTFVTYAESHDGGYSFEMPPPPANLVASLPYVYDKFNKGGTEGYQLPTNILKRGNDYYAMVNVWREYKGQAYGPCLIRTTDVFTPTSWRAWDGHGFTIRFIDPYRPQERAKDDAPSRHVCASVMPGTIDSLVQDEKSGVIVASAFVGDDRYGQGPGLYIFGSVDLIHWSAPVLLAGTRALLDLEPPGNWSYFFFSILDPKSQDRNFSTIADSPYVYYVRLDDNNGPYARVLFRRRLQLSIDVSKR